MKESTTTEETLGLFSNTKEEATNSVFSTERTVQVPSIDLPKILKPNTRLKMDGLKLLSHLPNDSLPVAFLDPQYRAFWKK